MQRVFLGIFLGVAVLMLGIATISGISTARKIASEAHAQGHVIEIVDRDPHRRHPGRGVLAGGAAGAVGVRQSAGLSH